MKKSQVRSKIALRGFRLWAAGTFFLGAAASLDAQPVNTVQATLHIGYAMMGIGVTKDNHYVYVVGSGNSVNSLFMIDASTNSLSTNTISLGGYPQFLAMAPNGKSVMMRTVTRPMG